ncbi:potassium channel protein [Pontibacillus yanchengensis]|uniref:Potassium channel protein n=2 Tax=Pontibacillus yanchengensis TaxID=462910 RepID=A0ACC7VIV0_9BACI|nr:potassium channel protein [Pontibacillus yanchengensis]MYL35728.1 potassium channel protein [Pontibacillus yanchengensis]MYL54555.1 potassium channel protein [Pontibacillus yanchengensis]
MVVKKRLILIFLLSTLLILIGSIGYMILEDLDFFDSLWLTVVSVLTVGYGDAVPSTLGGKLFTLALIPIAIGIVTYTLGITAATIIEGTFSKEARMRKMEKKLSRLENHFILCGFGRVGEQVYEQLLKHNHTVVIIDRDEEVGSRLGDQVLLLNGDATDDETLEKAGVEKAAGLVTTLPNDADNVFVTLTVKGLNDKLQVVARAEKQASEEKLKRAGADRVINPSHLGGRRMALSILKPVSIEYIDTILHAGHEDYNVEEIEVSSSSAWHKKSIKDLNIRAIYGITVVGIKRGEQFIRNPAPDESIHTGDVLIVFGEQSRLDLFEKQA